MNRYALLTSLTIIAACGSDPLSTSADDPVLEGAFEAMSTWVEMVTGGGTNDLGSYTEWISVSVSRNGLGELTGMYEYANRGLQDWRYHGEPDCLAISADGTRVVTGGPITLSQGPDAPPLGTRVGFFIEDNGAGQGVDRAGAVLAGGASCEFGLIIFDLVQKGVTSGNYTIARR